MSRKLDYGGFGCFLGFAVGLVLGTIGLGMYCSMIMESQDRGEEVRWPIPRGLGQQGWLPKLMHDAEAKKGDSDTAADKAIAEYTESIRLGFAKWTPLQAAWAYFGRAIAYEKRGDPDGAVADYGVAICMAPNSVDAYRCRAIAYARRGDVEMAIADMTEAIRLDPKDANAYIDRGIIYAKKRDYKNAIADYSQAIQIDPNGAKAYRCRGVAYGEAGEIEKAIIDFTNAIQLDPKCADAHYNRAIAFEKRGESDKAAEDFNRAKQLGHKAM